MFEDDFLEYFSFCADKTYTDSSATTSRSQSERLNEESTKNKEPTPAEKIPVEILRKIFGHLDRASIDNCELVNRRWNAVARRFSSEYQLRRIDYIVFSTLGCFSITTRSHSRICRFECANQFVASELKNSMAITKKHFPAPPQDVLLRPGDLYRYQNYHIRKSQPHCVRSVKTYRNQLYHLETPPLQFFQVLNGILVGNTPVVGHIGFFECVLDKIFVERLLAGVNSMLCARQPPWFMSRRRYLTHSERAQIYYNRLVLWYNYDPFEAAKCQCQLLQRLANSQEAEEELKRYIQTIKLPRKTIIRR